MFMVNFEENADVVKASSYAPMMMRWLPDGVMPANLMPSQIIFNSSSLFVAPSYHVQRMFRDALLDQSIHVSRNSPSVAKAVASMSLPHDGGVAQNLSLKLINFGGPSAEVIVELDGFGDVDSLVHV